MTSRKLFSGAAATLATLCFTAGIQAQSVTEVSAPASRNSVAITVAVDDLNLSSPKGQEILQRRLNAAAEAACGPSQLHRAGSVKQAMNNAECREAALSRAMARIHSTAVAVR